MFLIGEFDEEGVYKSYTLHCKQRIVTEGMMVVVGASEIDSNFEIATEPLTFQDGLVGVDHQLHCTGLGALSSSESPVVRFGGKSGFLMSREGWSGQPTLTASN